MIWAGKMQISKIHHFLASNIYYLICEDKVTFGKHEICMNVSSMVKIRALYTQYLKAVMIHNLQLSVIKCMKIGHKW